MSGLLRFARKLWFLLRREHFARDLEEEMAFHRDLTAEEIQSGSVADSSNQDDARYAAMRRFGNATRIREQSHEQIAFRAESVWHDFRYALRQLGRNRGFAFTAILILALGIGASTAIFAFVDAALIRPLPYAQPTRLVEVQELSANFPRSPMSYPDFADWKRMNTVFSSMDAFRNWGYLLNTPSGGEPVYAEQVSAGFFRTLGVVPLLGRDFQSNEDAPEAAPVAMLSYGSWQRRFGGRREIVGSTILLSGKAVTIIGVLPQSFQFAMNGSAEFWTPLQPIGECLHRRSCHNLDGVGRLKDGVTVEAARANMVSIADQLERQYPDSNRGQSASVLPLAQAITGDIRPILLIVLGGAGLLLLIACVNVSSLLVVRSESRKREIAVRGALGASPARLMRQFVTEGLTLVALGAMLGLAVAWLGMHVLHGAIAKDVIAGMPYLDGLGLNSHVLLFAAAISLAAAVLFALTPILHLSFADLRDGLTEGGRGAAGMLWRKLGANMVIIELATAMVLLVNAGLLGRSLYRLLHIDLGFPTDHLATLSVSLPDGSFSKDEQIIAFHRRLLDSISTLPGVRSAATTSVLPVTCNCNTDWIRFVGKPYNGIHNEVNEREISPAFFITLGGRLQHGRYFTANDDATHPKVAIVNESFVRKYYPGEDPIGKKFGDTSLTPASLKEIVGVVADFKDSALDQQQWPAVYYPFEQNTEGSFSVMVRTSQDDATMLPQLANAIHRLDADVGVGDTMTMSQRIRDSYSAWLHRSAAMLVGGFASLALLLGVVGLYGVIAYSVSQRTREIGVRMALGAHRGSVYRLVLREAGKLTAIGLAAGMVCAVTAATALRGMLFGIRSWDVPTLAAVALVLGASALAASYIPARRAASVNPVEALRSE
jgi:macrolide transport system ATP-binding/permease protein